jgi:hypothetical protein
MVIRFGLASFSLPVALSLGGGFSLAFVVLFGLLEKQDVLHAWELVRVRL